MIEEEVLRVSDMKFLAYLPVACNRSLRMVLVASANEWRQVAAFRELERRGVLENGDLESLPLRGIRRDGWRSTQDRVPDSGQERSKDFDFGGVTD